MILLDVHWHSISGFSHKTKGDAVTHCRLDKMGIVTQCSRLLD